MIALFGTDGLAAVLAGLEDVVDLLDARLAGRDFCLRTLWASLGGDDQAVGIGQGFLQVTLLGRAIGEDLLQLLDRLFAETLRHRHHCRGLEAREFAGVLDGLPRGGGQLLLEVDQLLLVITPAVELVERGLQDRLQGLFVGIRQFAVGQFVQAGLHGFAGRRFSGIQRADGRLRPSRAAKRKSAG